MHCTACDVMGYSLRHGRGVSTFAHVPRPPASSLTSLRQTHHAQGYERSFAATP